ncbi:hypothetical protein INR49_020663 [Caranx melampygus]|nr:hypothetical protein INR49_020663 [Caranx melampygus]
MEPSPGDDPAPAAALLRFLLSLDVAPGFGAQVLELYRLQAAVLRRRRRRELMESERRQRQYLRRRRAFLLSSVAAALSLLSGTSRLVWVRARLPGQNLWATAEAFDDEEWKAQFRVSRATFDFLLELIGPAIKRRRTNYRVPIEPRRRLAITLWWFARSGEYRTIADMFDVGIATVCMIVRQVSSAIVERLLHRFVFTDVYAGWPGSSSSAAVLSSSDLYLKAEDRPDGYLFPRERSLLSEGVEIPVHLIGDASLPLKPWLMKGYTEEQQLSSERRRFTYTLTSARSVVDAAFTRLKGRWRCLLKKSDIDVSVMPRVVAACCVLHNVCEQRGDGFLPEWSIEAAHGHLKQPDAEVFEGDTYCAAEVIRDTITYNLLTILQH